MSEPRSVPADHPAFAALPVRLVTVGHGGERIAVHIFGPLRTNTVPLVCIAGYHRNMSDFGGLRAQIAGATGAVPTLVLLDLLGRGRSSDRRHAGDYISPNDARDVAAVADALGIGSAIFLGQGYGGQVIMAIAARRPTLIEGAVLIDAGPVSNPLGLVRLRSNLEEIQSVRGTVAFERMSRQMLGVDYPALTDPELDVLASRTHFVAPSGAASPLFDPALLKAIEGIEHDDVLVPQWSLFGALGAAPLLMMRTQLTRELRPDTFEEMMRLRRDAEAFIIEGQGSPALLDNAQDLRPIAQFVANVPKWRRRFSIGSTARVKA